jgi:hypothetical protein
MSKARNVINVLSADVVVICGGGGPGTTSEAAHAHNMSRPLILLAVPVLWSEFYSALGGAVEIASDVRECCRLIEARLNSMSRPSLRCQARSPRQAWRGGRSRFLLGRRSLSRSQRKPRRMSIC